MNDVAQQIMDLKTMLAIAGLVELASLMALLWLSSIVRGMRSTQSGQRIDIAASGEHARDELRKRDVRLAKRRARAEAVESRPPVH